MKKSALLGAVLAVLLLVTAAMPAASVFAAETVSEIRIGVPLPDPGDTFDPLNDDAGAYISGEGARCSVEKSLWYPEDGTASGPFTFEPGRKYYVEISIAADEGFAFAEDTAAYINGEEARGITVHDERHASVVSYEYTVPGAIETIGGVYLEVDLPNAGDTFDTESGDAGVHPSDDDVQYTVEKSLWYPEGGETSGPFTFTGGQKYYVSVYLKADKGYTFSDDTDYYINGKRVPYVSASKGEAYVSSVMYTVAAESEPVGDPRLTLTIPYAEDAYDSDKGGTAVPEGGANYSVVKVIWIRTGGDVPQKFRGGELYYAEIYLQANEGYAFEENAYANVNGEDAAESKLQENGIFYIRTVDYLIEPPPEESASPEPVATPAPTAFGYNTEKGIGSTWIKQLGGGLEFVFRRTAEDEKTFSLFRGVRIDGRVVDSRFYKTEQGSLVLTISDEYLGLLADGVHALLVMFEDGTAEVEFTVVAGPEQTPENTAAPAAPTPTQAPLPTFAPEDGGGSPLPWIIAGAVLLLIAGGITAAVLIIRKNRVV